MKATPNNNSLEAEDAGEFAGLTTLDMIAAYLFQRHGQAAVREAFESNADIPSESLEKAAEELEVRGLDQVAAILRDIAMDCPSGIEFNPYESGSVNWHYWRESWIRNRRQATGELEHDLRQHHAQQLKQKQAEQSKASQTTH